MGVQTEYIFHFILLCCLSAAVFAQNEVDEDPNKLSKANAYFTDKLYKQLSSKSGNLVFSPMSIAVAFSMLSFGAGGNTFNQINSTLGFPFAQLNEQELLEAYQNLVTSLTESREGYQYSLANAQFLQYSFPFYSNYSRVIAEDFHAESRTVNFANQEETLGTINGWVSNATHGKITSILEDVTPLDVMALVNAVYFKGTWLNQFEESRTSDVDFFNENETRNTVKMMSAEVLAKYDENHPIGGSVLELPYKGRFFSMIFVLPEFRESLRSVEEKLTPEVLLRISDSLEFKNLTVGIPKMKLESHVDLVSELQAIGIVDAFNGNADLHRISPASLYVSQAVHKATIELNEEGSEASAATAVVTSLRTGGYRTYFWANRPFMFLLRHNPTNTVCFMGKVVGV